MASSLLNEASAAIGADLDSPVVNAAAIVLWAGVWWMVSAISLQWLTPRGLPAVPDEKRWHWARTVMSTVHAALTALLACYYVFYVQDLNMWGDFATRHRGWEQVVCCSLGYFLFDLIHISILKPTPSDYYESVFHHLLTLYVHFIPVCVYHGYVQLSMVGYLAELSTPFVNIRWFMLKASLTDHPYYLVNGGLMAVVFFACRIVNGLWLLYVTVYQAWFAPYSNSARTFSEYMGAVGYALGPLITLFYLLWSYWFILIVQGIKAAVLGSDFKNDPDQEGGSLVGRAIESVASPKSSKKE